MRKDLEEAAEIVEKLQEWIEDREELSTCPVASLGWSTTTLQISVANVVVYDDQCTDGDDFTLEACKAAWIDHVRTMHLPFAEECSR